MARRKAVKPAVVEDDDILEDFDFDDEDLEETEEEEEMEAAEEQPVKRRRGRPRKKAADKGNGATKPKKAKAKAKPKKAKRTRKPAEIRVATVGTIQDEDSNDVNVFELLDHPPMGTIGEGEKWLRDNAPGDSEVVVLRVARRFAPRVRLTRIDN